MSPTFLGDVHEYLSIVTRHYSPPMNVWSVRLSSARGYFQTEIHMLSIIVTLSLDPLPLPIHTTCAAEDCNALLIWLELKNLYYIMIPSQHYIPYAPNNHCGIVLVTQWRESVYSYLL